MELLLLRMRKFKYIFILVFVISFYCVSAQRITPDTEITICQGYINPIKALSIIETQENIRFSYNTKSFQIKTEIYLCKRNKSLKEILSYILGKDVELIIEGNYVIIKPDNNFNKQNKSNSFRVYGIIENATNGMPLDSVTIETCGYQFYTNETGFFSFKANTLNDSVTLFINKPRYIGYKTTIPSKDERLKIGLYSTEGVDYTYMPSSAKDKNSTIENHWVTNIVVGNEQKNISQNRRVLIDRNIQFSVIPGVGTYNEQSGLYRYHRSYNIVAGYVGEIYGSEIGVGINVIRYDLHGFQFSGLANFVGGEVSGLQCSFLSNNCKGLCRGMQISGLLNISWGNFKGFQLSSGGNIVRAKHRGFQLAPVNVVVDSLLGTQIGLVNICCSSAIGPQFAIGSNFSNINNKFQYSILMNSNKINNAPQLGIFNISSYQNSLQLGLINFADTVTGTTIGVLSFIKNGFIHLDYSLNSDLFSNIKFKTGMSKFYNIISVGLRPDNEPDITLGYGFGSYFHVWKMFGINYDLTASQVFENGIFNHNINILSSLQLNLNFSISKRFTIYAGGNINMVNTNNLSDDAITFVSTIPNGNVMFDQQFKLHRAYIWSGFQIGFRI